MSVFGEQLKIEKPEIRQELLDLEPIMLNLVKKLKKKIESGEYDTILSQDVGGRIPALILEKIMKAAGNKDLKVYFLSQGFGDDKRIAEFIEKRKGSIRKPLIITEYILSGRGLIDLLKDVEKGGLKDYDVATAVATYWGDKNVNSFLERKLNRKLYYGKIDEATPSFDESSQELTGVTRLDVNNVHPIRDVSVNQQEVIKARKDVKLVAKEIFDSIWR
jgi:hypothetical protein